jgi:hypothetical protein
LGRRGHKDPSCIFPPPNEFIIPTGYHPPPFHLLSFPTSSSHFASTPSVFLSYRQPYSADVDVAFRARSLRERTPPLTPVSWATLSVSDSLLAQFISFHLLPPSISPCCACPAPGTRPS